MAAAISNWYHSSLWTRSRQVQVAPLLARAEENARMGRGPSDAVVINMGDILADDPTLLNSIKPKKHETLFGPALGPVNSGPAWTNFGKPEGPKDELTQETVKAWIAKSKDPSQPTTTLQALVNLKRPSIRLSPLTPTDAPEEAPSTHHGLEFEYDLDAARGKLLLEVISPNPEAAPILIYEALVDGGFNKQLKIEDGAAFELTKLENHKPEASSSSAPVVPAPTETPAAASSTLSVPITPATKKRFSAFNFRKKARAAGPAVAVVDAQAPAVTPVAADGQPVTKAENKAPEEDEGGVRVRIRIEALDESDKPLSAVNAQTTYLHIVRVKPIAASETAENSESDANINWMVKVVKREATIGLHTFHLHEIYGLASSSAPAAPPTHNYPPNPEEEANHASAYDFAGTECVLCLSEPREVVLLPCRHLVACKDCALNMIEFGAGGQLTNNDTAAAAETPAGTTPGAAPGATEGELEAGLGATPATPAAPAVAPVVPAPTRRKRKAKGWFCPVCRQPYTSLLRITTTPPEAKKLSSGSEAELPLTAPKVPEPALTAAAASAPITVPTVTLSEPSTTEAVVSPPTQPQAATQGGTSDNQTTAPAPTQATQTENK